jgi:hypothetical protein
MRLKDFLDMPISDLSQITGIDKANWSRYLSGHPITESTLNKAGQSLKMPSYRLLKGIILRRQEKKSA